MNVRHAMRARRAMTAVAITTGLVLAAAGCSGGGDDDEPDSESSSGKSESSDQKSGGGDGDADEQDDNQVLAEVTGEDLTLTFNSAKREDGGFVTVTGKLKYSGNAVWLSPGWSGDEEELAAVNTTSMAGAKLTDKVGKKRYYILRDTDGRCLCTTFPKGIKGGETKTWYAQFPAPPEDSEKVDFQIADMPPASITISEG